MYILGKDGTAWIQETLELTAPYDNDETFSREVLSKVNLDEGEAYIAIATAEHHEAVTNNLPLKYGRLPLGSHNIDMQADVLLGKLKQIESERGPISIVVEDVMPNPNGPVDKYLESEVYHLYKQYLYIKKLWTLDQCRNSFII